MKPTTSIFSMIAIAGVLATPAMVVAQTAPSPEAAPIQRTAPNAAVPDKVAPPLSLPSVAGGHTGGTTGASVAQSTYVTAGHQLRASKMIGATVYNDQNQKIGSIDDLLISNGQTVDSAVLSVGGFLGIDSKLVKVSYSQIHVQDSKLVITGATKQQLTQLPQYLYKNS